jgi:hypothetical protein
VFPHRPSDNTARTKILDRTSYRYCQQLDRLCNCIANVTAWLYSSKSVLHLRIRVQHAVVAQETSTHKSRPGAATGSWFGPGSALGWNCACEIPTPWAFSVFSRTFIGRPSLSCPEMAISSHRCTWLFTTQSQMTHVPRSKIMFTKTKMQRTAIRWVPSSQMGSLS